MSTKIPTANYVTYFDPAKAHHRAWLQAVLDRLVSHEPDALQDGSELRDLWRAAVETKAPLAAPAEPAGLVSMAQATAVFGRTPRASQLADLNSCVERFNINTPTRLRHFMAQVGHESGGLSYVAAKYPFTSAGFWWHLNGMNPICDSGASCRQVSARVNGRDPANGLADREAYYARAVAAFPNITASKPSEPVGFGNPLQVPHYSQMDSTDRSQAARMCFSSSCAMLLQYLKPNTLSGPNGDDQYLKRVRQYGDTTMSAAQVRALSSYGIKAKFIQTADWEIIENQIDKGVPVPCGFLHRGPVSSPTGGGHWLIIVGYTNNHIIVHDPFGEADLVTGATIGGVARFMRYSRKNFGRRWMVKKAVDGTYQYAPGNGWAIIAERP